MADQFDDVIALVAAIAADEDEHAEILTGRLAANGDLADVVDALVGFVLTMRPLVVRQRFAEVGEEALAANAPVATNARSAFFELGEAIFLDADPDEVVTVLERQHNSRDLSEDLRSENLYLLVHAAAAVWRSFDVRRTGDELRVARPSGDAGKLVTRLAPTQPPVAGAPAGDLSAESDVGEPGYKTPKAPLPATEARGGGDLASQLLPTLATAPAGVLTACLLLILGIIAAFARGLALVLGIAATGGLIYIRTRWSRSLEERPETPVPPLRHAAIGRSTTSGSHRAAGRGALISLTGGLVTLLLAIGVVAFFVYTRSDSVRFRCLGEKVNGEHQSFPENLICAVAGP